MTTLRAESVSRVFETRGEAVHAVQEVSLEVRPGELLVVTGPSGAGKTTLLNLLGGLDRPTSGRVLLGDDELSALGEDELAAVRRDRLGYVFQSFGLIPVLSAAENVEVPLRLQRMPPAERDARVAESLELVGLGAHAAQRPYELSGGQQQRVGHRPRARRSPAAPPRRRADRPARQRHGGDRDGPHRRARALTRRGRRGDHARRRARAPRRPRRRASRRTDEAPYRTRTDRHVTQPSSFSNSPMSTVTTR